jgi:FSR family fosmidomycin resistance protein-like MFS transporter
MPARGTVLGTAGVVGVMVAGTLGDRMGRRIMLMVSLVGAPASVPAFGWGDGWIADDLLGLTGDLIGLQDAPITFAGIG